MFIAGLDKASNNPYTICIYHVRVHALFRLQEEDFMPTATFVPDLVSLLQDQLLELILEIQFRHAGLPYLMATYKLHKIKYH